MSTYQAVIDKLIVTIAAKIDQPYRIDELPVELRPSVRRALQTNDNVRVKLNAVNNVIVYRTILGNLSGVISQSQHFCLGKALTNYCRIDTDWSHESVLVRYYGKRRRYKLRRTIGWDRQLFERAFPDEVEELLG